MKTHVIDGVTYVEVEREAEFDEKIIIVKGFGWYKADAGAVFDVISGNRYGFSRESTDYVYVEHANNSVSEIYCVTAKDYNVLEPLESEEVTVDQSQASEQVIEMFAALSRKIVSLERQLADTQRNLETFAEQTENNSEDIRTLDSRTQVINAITKFYEEGSR